MTGACQCPDRVVELFRPHQEVDVTERAQLERGIVEVGHARALEHPNGDALPGEEIDGVEEEVLEEQHRRHRLAMRSDDLRGLLGPGGKCAITHREGEEAGQPLAADAVEQLGPARVRQRPVRQRLVASGAGQARESVGGNSWHELARVSRRDHPCQA